MRGTWYYYGGNETMNEHITERSGVVHAVKCAVNSFIYSIIIYVYYLCMKYIVFLLSLVLFGCNDSTFKDGDIIFHTSKSSQSDMLEKVTSSNLTHVGIIFYNDGEPFVIEGVQPVKITPLNDFISRGVAGKYKVVRYNRKFTDSQKDRMYEYARNQIGKDYDMKFEWSDDKMYCSELVFKTYFNGGITLCNINKFEDYDLSDDIIQKEIDIRYGGDINLNENVVTPVDLYESLSVHLIFDNY